MREIALYFGTFNPLHKGHKAIIDNLLSMHFDQVWLVISAQSPFKDEAIHSADDRLNGVKRDIERMALPVNVCDIEFRLPKPNYTINTLEELEKLYPDTKFSLAMGADNILYIEKWYRWRELLERFQIYVFPREGVDAGELCRRYGVNLVDAPLVNISSTDIRENRAERGI